MFKYDIIFKGYYMKKSSFINDSFISIMGIVICKVIGLLYVIPFYAMISTTGGALYSYAYSIYTLFLSLSTSGIPAANSKLISEYDTLGYKKTTVNIFKVGFSIITVLGLVGFILMMIFAPQLAHLLIGKMKGGNTIADIATVVRIIATALLIVPALSVTKGYFQGKKMFKEASVANIIEQIARVAFLLIGCYLCLYKFNMGEKAAIGAAVFSATVGALVAYLYLVIKQKKDHLKISSKGIERKEEELKLDTKYLGKQLIATAIPFILIDVLKSAYGMVDALTVIRGMTYLGYSAKVSELALATFATWGAKLTMIVISISMGLTISLIPNIASDNIKGNKEGVNHKINLSIELLTFVTLPMAIGMSILGKPIWILFYSYNAVSISIFKFFIYTAASFAIYSVVINIAQTLNHTKQVLIALTSAFLLNLVGNIPWMIVVHKMGFGAYHGAIVSTLITELGPAILLLYYIKRKHGLKFKELYINMGKILISSFAMVAGLKLLSIVYPLSAMNRKGSIIEVIVYATVGGLIYLFFSYVTGLLKEMLGERLLKHPRLSLHFKL